MKKLISLILFTFFTPVIGQAYIPPSSFLIQQMALKRKSLKGLRVKTRITGAQSQIKEIAWYDANTKKIKARILDSEDHEIYAYERSLNEKDSLVSILLLESNPKTIESALLHYQIPVVPEERLLEVATDEVRRSLEKTSISRINQKIGWAIGKGSPSFWITKDEFTPLLLKVKTGMSGIEFRFEDTKETRGIPYARSISVYRGNDFILKGEAMEVMMNPDLSDSKAIQVSGTPALPSSLEDSTKKLIEQWVLWVR